MRRDILQLHKTKLGLSGGILLGVALFFITQYSYYTEYGSLFLELIADLYPGYTISFWGSFVGFVYAFIDGFCFFFLLAWLYNFLVERGET